MTAVSSFDLPSPPEVSPQERLQRILRDRFEAMELAAGWIVSEPDPHARLLWAYWIGQCEDEVRYLIHSLEELGQRGLRPSPLAQGYSSRFLGLQQITETRERVAALLAWTQGLEADATPIAAIGEPVYTHPAYTIVKDHVPALRKRVPEKLLGAASTTVDALLPDWWS